MADRGWLQVRPSEAQPGLVAPKLERPLGVVDTDSPHLVHWSEPSRLAPVLCSVYLCGTGGTPVDNNPCTEFLAASSRQGLSTVGLCYQWGNLVDAERNAACASQGGQSRLEAFHRDVLFGGCESGLVDVTRENCVVERLVALLEHLARTRPAPEAQGWAGFLQEGQDGTAAGARRTLRWELFIFSGHSQGSGHVAHLAKFKPLAGALFVSGPQELMPASGDAEPSWLSTGAFATQNLLALAHVDEEHTSALIRSCWRAIAPLQFAPPAQDSARFDGTGSSAALESPSSMPRTFSTDLAPAKGPPGTAGARPNHMSTVSDSNTPRDEATGLPVYAPLWGRLFAQLVAGAGAGAGTRGDRSNL